jgi:hypothetical protein
VKDVLVPKDERQLLRTVKSCDPGPAVFSSAKERRTLTINGFGDIGFGYFIASTAAPVASGWSVRRVGLSEFSPVPALKRDNFRMSRHRALPLFAHDLPAQTPLRM